MHSKHRLHGLILILLLSMAAPAVSWAEPAQSGDIYLIATPADLNWFRDEANKGGTSADIKAKLTADIDLGGANWTPIGIPIPGAPNTLGGYAGIFDGGGHTVKGYLVTSSDAIMITEGTTHSYYLGLFSYIAPGGVVSGLAAEGVVSADFGTAAHTYSSAGLIAGDSRGTIRDCRVKGEVTLSGGYANYAGGVAGVALEPPPPSDEFGKISGCHADVRVLAANASAQNNAGGIASMTFLTLSNCFSKGAVSAAGTGNWSGDNAYAGCIAGENFNMITNCASIAEVSAKDADKSNCAGGIAGRTINRITNCAAGGKVTATGTGSYAGGIAGYNSNTITNCGWLTSAADEGIGGSDPNNIDNIKEEHVVSLDLLDKTVTTILPVNLRLTTEVGSPVPELLQSYPGTADEMSGYVTAVSADITPEIAAADTSYPCSVTADKPGVAVASFNLTLHATDFSDKANLKPLASGTNYLLSFALEAADAPTPPTPTGGSSGGCAAGLGSLALLALAPLALRKKR